MFFHSTPDNTFLSSPLEGSPSSLVDLFFTEPNNLVGFRSTESTATTLCWTRNYSPRNCAFCINSPPHHGLANYNDNISNVHFEALCSIPRQTTPPGLLNFKEFLPPSIPVPVPVAKIPLLYGCSLRIRTFLPGIPLVSAGKLRDSPVQGHFCLVNSTLPSPVEVGQIIDSLDVLVTILRRLAANFTGELYLVVKSPFSLCNMNCRRDMQEWSFVA